MRALAAVFSASMVALLFVSVGCSSDDNSNPSASNFYGLYADSTGTPGTITLTGVAPATTPLVLGGGASTPLGGTLNILDQLPIDLTGLYFTETGALSFASEDDAYTFTGQVTLGSASGTSTGPNGPGVFTLFTGGTPATTAVFCGETVCDPGPCKSTIEFNLAVSSSSALLTAFTEGGAVSAVGTRMGDNVSFHITGTGFDVTVQGVINGPSVGGSWVDNVSQTNGLWNGSTGGCSAPAH